MVKPDGIGTNVRSKAAKGIRWIGIQRLSTQSSLFLVVLLLARQLGPDEFGLAAIAFAYAGLLQLFVDQGLGDAIVQRERIDQSDLSTAFWFSSALGTVLCCLGCLLAPIAGRVIGDPSIVPIIRILSLNFLVSAMGSIPEAILKRGLGFDAIAKANIVSAVLSGGCAVTLAFSGGGVWSLVGQQVMSVASRALMYWRHSKWLPNLRFRLETLRWMAKYGWNIVGINIVNFGTRYGDQLLVGYYVGTTQLGSYSFARKINQAILSLTAGIPNAIAFPAFSRLGEDAGIRIGVFLEAVRLTSSLTGLVFALVCGSSYQLVEVVFGEKWIESGPILCVLAVIGFHQGVFVLNHALLKAAGYPNWSFRLVCVNASVNVIFVWFAAPHGALAVVVAALLRASVLSSLPLLVLKSKLGLSIKDWRGSVRGSVLGFVVCVLSGWAYGLLDNPLDHGAVDLLIRLGIGVAAYLGGFYVFDRNGFSDIYQQVWKLVFNIRMKKRSV